MLLMRAVPLGPAVLLVLAELVQLKSGHASLTSSSLKNPWKRGLRWPGRRPRGPTPMMGLVAAMTLRAQPLLLLDWTTQAIPAPYVLPFRQGKSPRNLQRPINHAGTSPGQSTASSTESH